jgi:hypothetical protein
MFKIIQFLGEKIWKLQKTMFIFASGTAKNKANKLNNV